MWIRLVICFALFVIGFAAASLPRFLGEEGPSRAVLSHSDRTPAVQRLSERIVPKSSLAQRLESLLEQGAPSAENKDELEAILAQIVKEDPAYLISLFRNGTLNRKHKHYLVEAVRLQISNNPSFMSTLPRMIDGWVGEEMWSVALQELGKSDPQLALEHYDRMGTLDREILNGIYETWQEIDLDAAWSAYWETHHFTQRGIALEVPKLFTDWAHAQPDAAYEWIRDTPMLIHIKREFVRNFIDEFQPEQTVRMTAESIDAFNDLANELGLGSQKEAIEALRMANVDPEAAFELVKNIPQLYQHMRVLTRIMDDLMSKDPDAALDYASTHALRDLRVKAYADYGTALANESPSDALEWAQALDDTAARDSALSGVLTAWGAKDPEAAMEALRTSRDAFDPEGQSSYFYPTLASIVEALPKEGHWQPGNIAFYSRIWDTFEDYDRDRFKVLLEKHVQSPAALQSIFKEEE